jgi:hypothetical protein
MQFFLRVAAIYFLFAAIAFAGESSPRFRPPGKILAVSVMAPDDSKIAETLDTRDLEHVLVARLKRNRISAIAFTSIEEILDSDEGVYVIDVGIDQADIAQRPQWSWLDKRFRDEEILHLELSLTVTRLENGEALGYLYRSYDYSAEEYGQFSSPQAMRGAVYESIGALASDFVAGVERGDFGSELDSFRHAFTLEDAFDQWSELSVGLKVALMFVAVLLFILLAAFAYNVTSGIARLLGLTSTDAYVVVREECPLRRRKASAVLQAQRASETEEDVTVDEG